MDQLFDAILLLTCFQGLVGAGLLISGKPDSSRYLLALFILCYIGTGVLWGVYRFFPDYYEPVRYLPIAFSYAIAPLFFLYCKSVLNTIKSKDLLHLIPALLEIVFGVYCMVNPAIANDIFANQRLFVISYLIILPPLYNLFYLFWSARYVQLKKPKVLDYYTDVEKKRLNWILAAIFVIGGNFLLELIASVVKLNTDYDFTIDIFTGLTGCFIVYWVSYNGWKQRNLFKYRNQSNSVDLSTVQKTLVEKRSDSNQSSSSTQIDQNELDEDDGVKPDLFSKVCNYLEQTRIYIENDIHLERLANLIEVHPKTLSTEINSNNLNFNQLINNYRVEEVKKMLADSKYEKYTIETLGQEVGFNSKSVFYAAFKKVTGMTPSQYKKKLLK
ncbi:MAG: AraC family transcriptional regulator [Nonlabens sp.]